LFRRIYEKEYGPLDVNASELVVQSCGHADKQIKVATSETTSKIIIKKESTEGKSMSLDTDIALAKALDPLLPMVTGGLINDSAGLMGLIRDKGVLEGKIIDLTTKLGAAEARASAKPLAIGKIETTTGEFPTGNLETRLASDVFDFKGKTAKAFAFDVPVFDWDAPHPLVPTIDPDYVFDLKNTALILDALVNGDNAWVFGHTGSGKTTIIEQIAARLSWPLMRINGDSDISRFELIGKTDLRDGATVFTEGVLPIGLQNGCIILMDEYDMLRGETAYVLQRLAEGKGLMLLEDGGRYVAPHPMTRLIAACNSRGNGDEFGIYPAVRTQSAAVRSRFTAWVEHDYLKTDQETQLLIKKTGIGEEMAGKFVRLANEVRDAFKRGVILEVVSPRELLAAATRYMRLSSRLGDEREATRMTLESALLSRCSSADRATLSEISQRVFGV
jgi:cobaltochelatase CobS